MKTLKFVLMLALMLVVNQTMAKSARHEDNDRKQWTELCYKMAQPILENMSKGELQKNMNIEYSPTWDGRDKRVVYMEAFGRLMAGISPWLAMPEDDTKEGKMRKQLHTWALASYKNAVDPNSPDFLLWHGPTQVLVDAAYIVESFMRAPEATWHQLDKTTQQRYIECFKNLRDVRPAYNNWLLFRSMIEAWMLEVGEKADMFVLTVGLNKINEWYLSDGFYSDGAEFALDYYNSFVMHPMLLEVLEVCKKHKVRTPISTDLALQRMQRFNHFLERMISPEGTYPAMGRSITYRMGAFQTLGMAAWKYGLPEEMTNGQVRNALTTVMHNMFKVEGNFDKDNYLQLGFAGHQPNLSNYYTNNGSLYMTSLVFTPLGLPADHPFWTAPDEEWTSQKAWSGKPFPIDGHVSLRTEKK